MDIILWTDDKDSKDWELIPESEIIKYATELKAMTQASGRFTRSFLRYDVTPEDKIKNIGK